MEYHPRIFDSITLLYETDNYIHCPYMPIVGMSRRNNRIGLSRRKVLRGMVGVSAGSGILSTVASQSALAASGIEEDIELSTLTDNERNKVVSSALSDREVQKIREAFVNEGRQMQRSNASAWLTTVDGKDYTSVHIPFDTSVNSNQKGNEQEPTAYILWSSVNDRPAVGHFYPSGAVIENIDNTNKSVAITKVAGDQVTTHESSISGDQVTPQAAACYCTGDIDLECIGKTALTLGVTSDPCWTCYVDVTRVTCLACAAGLLLSGWSLAECCTDCWECCNTTFPFTCRSYC